MPKKFRPVIYLASQSPRRRQILNTMKIRFRAVHSTYHEKKIPGAGPEQMVMWHACQKARQAEIPASARFVLGADTVVVFKNHILGKPKNKKDAVRMLAMLSGKPHSVFTGVSILDRKQRSLLTGYARTDVFFKKLSAKMILDYIETVHVLDKAGAYAIQEGPKIVAKIKGSYSNVVGLPTELLRSMLNSISPHPGTSCPTLSRFAGEGKSRSPRPRAAEGEGRVRSTGVRVRERLLLKRKT